MGAGIRLRAERKRNDGAAGPPTLYERNPYESLCGNPRKAAPRANADGEMRDKFQLKILARRGLLRAGVHVDLLRRSDFGVNADRELNGLHLGLVADCRHEVQFVLVDETPVDIGEVGNEADRIA